LAVRDWLDRTHPRHLSCPDAGSALAPGIVLNELLADLTVYPYTKETALLAGKIDGEQQSRGLVIPFADLLIGATALSLGYQVLTGNPRDFQRIPGLSVAQL
jgi:tRNA(fMet)-specific endonuclease VapC